MTNYITNVTIDGKQVNIKDAETSNNLTAHIKANNPHHISKATIGLGNVDNTKDSEKSVLHATTADRLTSGNTGITLDQVYPVGSIYMSVNDVEPETLFGGTWELLHGRFLIGASKWNGYPVESTGGEATHMLTTAEMPAHEHGVHFYTAQTEASGNYGLTPGGGFGGRPLVYNNGSNQSYDYVYSVGGTQPHNNMPPYLAVYMWKRIA